MLSCLPSERSETGGYTVFTFVCLSVCLCVCAHWVPLVWMGGMTLFGEKCIRLVYEKLTLFPYGQDIVGNVVLLAFWWYSQVQDRSGGFGEMYENVTLMSRKMDFLHTPQHAVQRWRHCRWQASTAHYATKGSFIGRYAPDSLTAA